MAGQGLGGFLALLGGVQGALWSCSPPHTAAGGRICVGPAGQLEYWGPSQLGWAGELGGTGYVYVGWRPAPPSLSLALSLPSLCRPATLVTNPRSQTGAAGKPRMHGSRAGRSQAPRSHPLRAHGWPASITGVDRSLVTKATPLLPCQCVGRLVPRYSAPVQWEGAGLGWTSTESRPPLQPTLPFPAEAGLVG